MRIGVIAFAALCLTACGGETESADAVPAEEARQTAAAPAPPARPADVQPATPAPEPTAADSAAAAREDVSPEWKLNERSMAPYAECMAQASTLPENVRARVEAGCRTRPGAP